LRHYRLVTFIEDNISRLEPEVKEFSRRFHEGSPQNSALLNALSNKLRGMYKFFDPVIASTIIQSFLAFIDACILENRRDYETMPQSAGGERWARYIRSKNGIPDGYALFNFPMDIFPDASSYLQIIPDLGDIIIFGNDVLS